MVEEVMTPSAEVRLSVPWGHLAGRWYGDQMRRPILALHGWLDNCDSYITLAPLLLSHCSLLCIDLPGHGHSSQLPLGTIYNRHHYVIIVMRIMEAYKWEKVSLMGHSMGAAVAFEFATYHPKRVDLLITLDLLNCSIVPQLDYHIRYMQYSTERALIENDRLVHSSPMSEPPSYTFEECEYLLYEGTNESVHLDKCKYLLGRNISPSRKYPAKYYFSRDGRAKTVYSSHVNDDMARQMATRLCQTQLPYLMIKASDSNPCSKEIEIVRELLAKHNPKFEQHVLAGERHHLHLNNPAPVAALITAFLEKHPQKLTETKPMGVAKL